MALATTCPQCKTSFKVVPDQLKLRRGLVRCGVCQHVFSGIDFLRYVDESKRGVARDAGPPSPAGAEGGNLETAFFLPETILAAPPPADDAGRPAEARDHEGADEAEPIVGTSGSDLLALGREPSLPDAEREEDAGPFGPSPIDWPGAQIDWRQDPTLPLATESTDDGTAVEGDDGDSATPDRERVSARESVPEGEAVPEPEPDRSHLWTPVEEAAGEPAQEPAPQPDRDRDHEDRDEARDVVESLTATAPAGFVGIGQDEVIDDLARGGTRDDLRDDLRVDLRDDLRDDSRGGARGDVHGGTWARDARALPRHDDEEPVIDYFSSGGRGVGFVDRHGPIALLGAALLVVLLGLQWAIAQRSMIAARVPALAPVMSVLVAPFGLSVGPPRDLESLTIESFELQASATPGVLAMSALLRNRADYTVQWPSMQLTLTDATNRVLVRKVLSPDDYLRESGADGVPARAEWPVRMALEAKDLDPAGYSVVLFYP